MIKYSIAKPSDYDEILELQAACFDPDEKLGKRLMEHYGTTDWPDREMRTIKALNENFSTIGRDVANGNILVSAYMIGTVTKDSEENLEKIWNDSIDIKYKHQRSLLHNGKII